MSNFRIHTLENAPEGSKKQLEEINGKFGFIPNIFGVLAGSPVALAAYPALVGAFEKSSFTPEEREVVAIATGVENGCSFCTAVHSTIGRNKLKIQSEAIDALRSGKNPSDKKLGGLAQFTRTLVQKRGAASSEDLQAFKNAGYTDAQALELVIGVALNVFTNYTNNLADTPLNEQFKAEEWQGGAKKQAA